MGYFKRKTDEKQKREYLIFLFRDGISIIKEKWMMWECYLILIIVDIAIFLSSFIYLKNIGEVLQATYVLMFTPLLLILTIFGIPIIVADPIKKSKYADAFVKAGVVNAAGEPPMLKTERKIIDPEYGGCKLLDFQSNGISLAELNDKKDQIATAIKQTIYYIYTGVTVDRAELIVGPPDAMLPTDIAWSDEYTPKDDSIYVLGMALPHRLLTYSTDVSPNLLVAAATGGGKTNFIRSQIKQALARGTQVILIDKKRGIDFGKTITDRVKLLKDDAEIESSLEEVVTEMERRFDEIALTQCATNIKEYREAGRQMQRILIVVDEMAQLSQLSKGATAEEKKRLQNIISMLCKICQLGRAAGITTVLSTQRPSADVIDGQIRSDINVRICGRADENLSRVVFGDGRADEQVPKNVRGRFMLEDGTQFQAFIVPKE